MRPASARSLFQAAQAASTIGRQRDQNDVGGDGERIRAMPTCLIEDHHRMFVLSDGFCKAVEEDLRRRGIGVGRHHREGVVCAWLYGREDIGEGEAPVAKPRRPLAALPPDMTDAALLADARLVLKEQAQALAFMTDTDVSKKRRGSF